jgi:DNA adenine methylase
MSEDLMALFQALDDSDENIREGYVRSPLNYTGSKFESLNRLLPLIPYEDKWCDVFGGSGAVTLARKTSKFEVFNDRCSGVTAFFRALVDHLDELLDLIKLMPHAREMFTHFRHTIDDEQDTVKRAAKWYYMIQASFNGRGTSFGRITKSNNGQIWRKIQGNLDLFPMIHDRFRSVQIENLDWRDMFKDFDTHKTVWYLDPPYVDSNMYKHAMTKDDHIEMCHRVFQLEGWVGLSGFDNCKPIYDKFDWDECYSWPVKNISKGMAFKEGNNKTGMESITERDYRTEYLWIKDFS